MSVQSNPGLLWFCFTSFCDWSKNSRHSLNQSDLKLKPSATWSIALQAVCLFNLEFSLASCDIFPALIGCCYFDLVLVPRHSIRKHSNIGRYGNLCVESGPGLIALVSLYFLLNFVLKKHRHPFKLQPLAAWLLAFTCASGRLLDFNNFQFSFTLFDFILLSV